MNYTQHPLYRVHANMKQRCYNPNFTFYEYYGGRGIEVYKPWHNAAVFINWALKNGWEPGLQVDRKDNDRGYSPVNCRFVTPRENIQNGRRAINSSGFTGIICVGKKWKSELFYKKERIYFGVFSDKRDAVAERNLYIVRNKLEKEIPLQYFTDI